MKKNKERKEREEKRNLRHEKKIGKCLRHKIKLRRAKINP